MPAERYNASTLLDARLAAGHGARTAIYSGDERISYAELYQRVCAMARALRALGVARENRVLLMLGDTPAFPVAFFGAMRTGAVPVPVNPLYKVSDHRFFLADSAARAIITEAAFVDKVNEALAGAEESVSVIVAEELNELLAAHAGEFAPAGTHRDDMAFWLYSSGSTGRPKGVVHLHGSIPATCETFAQHVLQLTADDIVFGRVLFHAYGLGNALNFPFSVGAATILSPGRPTPRDILDTIERCRPTVLCLVPTLYNAILNDPVCAAGALSSVRRCISAAEPLAPETWRRWQERFGLPILDGIGSTEMLHIFCSNTAESCRPGSSGRPVPGYELKIVDDDGRTVAAGETGHLLVSGPSAAPFYWRQREKSRRTMQGEWMVTGDRYRVDEDGFYWYEGRADDMLKVGGEWVSPIEIENTLMEHEAVSEAAVVGITTGGLMRIRAVVILTSPAHETSALKAELQEWCKERLQRYQYPHRIDFVTELPRTATGKIQRFKLRQEEFND
ncbi:MAG TPA: benzoate-CoA ligase family protein [Blastocatellia bacterium]|nr:benzoate-CoA ligase family protein [Blastocatellia bacterium]